VSYKARDAEQIKTIALSRPSSYATEAVVTARTPTLNHIALFVAPSLATDATVHDFKVSIIFRVSTTATSFRHAGALATMLCAAELWTCITGMRPGVTCALTSRLRAELQHRVAANHAHFESKCSELERRSTAPCSPRFDPMKIDREPWLPKKV
jgi:hypothetical protein